MAMKKRAKSAAGGSTNFAAIPPMDGGLQPAEGRTGRYLVLMNPQMSKSGPSMLSNRAGIRSASASDFTNHAVSAEALASDESIYFETLGVAVVNAAPDQVTSLQTAAAEESEILAIEEERYVYAIDVVLDRYLAGYKDAVSNIVDRLSGTSNGGAMAVASDEADVSAPFQDTDITWGLTATGVNTSQFTGKGVRVAVLDTGFDFGHPDYAGRTIVSQSFILGETANDGHGHGTHVAGSACGPRRPGQLPRYGVASEAELFVGKVLSNRGSGSDRGILAGIEWAINNKCAVISMSLGAATRPGDPFSRIYESAARRALTAGTLIIAAAGNESARPGSIAPVSHPANCPSILSVAAVDQSLRVSTYSCGGLNGQGGQVDISGPGDNVRSSWPRPTLYRSIRGTSMATPHVSGIAALYAEANPDVRGGALGWLLLQSARRLTQPTRDVGAGLVQAP
jgi:subtilisin family serine protease